MAGEEVSTVAGELLASEAGGFIGRVPQLEQLQACVSEVRGGASWTVVIEGEAGMGKTMLVQRLMSSLDDFDVLWASCDPMEQDLAFGVVDQLVRRFPPQMLTSSAMLAKAAFRDVAPAEVGAELIRILTTTQAHRPLVLAVDDVQWSDTASRVVLGFLERRLWTQRVLVLVTARTGSEALPGGESGQWWQRAATSTDHYVRMSLTGMDEAETSQMVPASGRDSISPAAVKRLVDYTGGHPLYLRSLLAAIPAGDLADLHRPLAAPESLTSTTRRAVDRLKPDSVSLVEALAVLGKTVPLPLAAQVAGVPASAEALEPALEAGLVQWWPREVPARVRIKHALQQEAIYQTVSPPRRRALHSAAASLVDANAAWRHRVAAADHTAPALAVELDAEADRLASLGQLSRSATLILWAAELSDSRDDHERRLLTGAIRLLLARDYLRCFDLTDAVRSCTESPTRTCVLGGLAYAQGDLQEAQWRLTEALRAADTQGPVHIAELACVWLGTIYTRQHQWEKALPLVLRAAGLDLPQPRAVNYARHLMILASDTLAETRPAPDRRAFTDGEESARAALAASLLLNPRGILREMAKELHAGMEDLKTLVRRQRVGEVQEIQVSEYFTLAAFQYLTGVWDDASLTAQHALTLATSSGQLFDFAAGHAIASMAAASQGRREVALDQLQASEQAAERTQLPLDQVYPVLARVILGQAQGDPHTMDKALKHLPAPSNGWQSWWLPLQVEAYTGTGRLDEAAEALGRLEAIAEDVAGLKVSARWLSGDLSMAKGDSDTASMAYRSGLALPADTDEIPFHRARLNHAYARLLLPTDPATAQRCFHRARETYLTIGATPFTERVTTESAGSQATRPPEEETVDALLEPLTARERAVARLVAEGMTNKETAQNLYVSPKTVEYHLGHIFEKLGLTSRRQLRRALDHQVNSGG
ncbi:AAA family ATPase [Streptomyces sp. NBC_01017]|uniref:helix-turn-helix transcriptional regulator n=1 Tax=Streptomyces sp. NBC_01017 TaxID=2903721 RepID=UPI00387015D6|nr:AAA family ATPase [Streptomyces sp. NBC_01017]WSV34923.1 AAA family ATPase [Streptomyces sp. NBC_01017]